MTTEAERYNEHMDAIARRISNAVSGEECADVLLACAAIAGYALRQLPQAGRDDALLKVMGIVREILDGPEPPTLQ